MHDAFSSTTSLLQNCSEPSGSLLSRDITGTDIEDEESLCSEPFV